MLLVSLPDQLPEKERLRLIQLVHPMEVWIEEHFLDVKKEIPLQKIQIWLTYGADVTEEALKQMPSLKWIQVFQSGVEKIPLEELKKRNILLTNIKGIHGIPMAEHAMSTILYFSKNFEQYTINKQKHLWNRRGHDDEVYGKTIAIFGAGTVGQAIAERCQDFGMHVIGVNTSGTLKPPFDEMYSMKDKEDILKKSDFVLLLLPSIPETYHCMSKREFSIMKESAYLINLGRGSLIHNKDLIDSLENGSIKGAAVDVFDEEPLPEDSPLWDAPHLLITPHMAARTWRYYERALEKFALNLEAYQHNEQPPYYIDLNKGY
ncbi:D-2-hydroxyacid dehydrogenase [Bacillus sp. B190/17]|uniref:D-2-hydroxyacid dehydrogenase n=1 Tax=Bacillus lumedeiriae TaxID=3058829 RepID=A0ABW8ICR9_9BACI